MATDRCDRNAEIDATTGAADSNNAVRLYRDAANDLAGPFAGGIVSISVTSLKTTR